MADLRDLIKRLEAATGPSYALEVEIAETLGRQSKPPNNYTYSLDAALTLVPEGMEWEATTLYSVARVAVGLNFAPGPFYGENLAGNVPLALCIAALKAREACNG